MKTCSKCDEEQPLENFYKSASGKDGRRMDCKACIKVMRASHYKENRETIVQYVMNWQRRKYRNDPEYNLTRRLRNRMHHALDGKLKSDGTFELLGCTCEQFKEHLERQFTDGMAWGQRGLWAVDHIIPLAAFDLSIPEHQRYAFHWSNCQPLWKQDNLEKSDSYDPADLEAYLKSDLPEYPVT